MKYRNKNFGKSPFDPDYIDGYDPEEDFENWLDEQEQKYQFEKENSL